MFSQVDGKVNWHILFQDIVDHRYDGTEEEYQDVFITTRTVTKCRKETKKGVEVIVQWKYGSTTWVTLKDMKNSYPVQLAEYVLHFRIASNPVFAWWIQHEVVKHKYSIGKLN